MNRLFSLLMAAFLCCSLQNLNAESAAQAEAQLTEPAHGKLTDAQLADLKEKLGASIPCGLSVTDFAPLAGCIGGKSACEGAIQSVMNTAFSKCCEGPDGSSAGKCVVNIAAVFDKINTYAAPLGLSDYVYGAFCQVGCSASLCGSVNYLGHSCLYFCDPNGNMGSCFNSMSGNLTTQASDFIKTENIGSLAVYTTAVPGPRVPVLRGINWPTTSGSKADCWPADNCPSGSCDADNAAKCRGTKTVFR